MTNISPVAPYSDNDPLLRRIRPHVFVNVEAVRPFRFLFPTIAAFAGGVLLGDLRAQATPETENPYQAVAQLGRVLVQVENNYVDPVDRNKVVEGAIKGMVENLDPHSSYLPPEEWKQFQSDTEGKFGGVGLEVDGRGEKLIVIAPIEGSPAYRAGIKSGDQIIAIDGEDVVGQALDKVVKRMRGGAGTKVRITVHREHAKRVVDANANANANGATKERVGDAGACAGSDCSDAGAGAAEGGAPAKAAQSGQTLTFEVTREVIHVAAVVAKLLDGNVAYFRIKQFQENTHKELLAGAAKLRAESKSGVLAGVLLDLRSNPGGLVDEATDIADEFLSTGGIYSMRRRGQVIEDLKANAGGAFVDVPVVALVNEWSASASELLVGALQDNKRATVVGANSFGKGSVQSILPLPNGAGLKLTTARYYTPSGHAIQADGIHPDVVIDPGTKAPAEAPRVFRERDLPGHLPAEGPQGGNTVRDGGANVSALVDGGTIDDVAASGQARDIPFDPSSSSDVVLRVGFQMLRTQMASQRPLAK